MRRALQGLSSALLLALLATAETAGEARSAGESAAPSGERPPNLLVIVADDVGTDRVGIYGEAEDPGRTPHIDRLGRNGLVFEHFWVMPTCSPTRAALLSGRYPHRTGIGSVVIPDAPEESEPVGLALDVEILPRALAQAGYSSAILGKWHLGTRAQGFDHAVQMGFDHHRGSFGNLGTRGGRPSYFHWTKMVDGVPQRMNVYATSDTVNDASELARQLQEPWLLVVSFNAAHVPLHVPPSDLHGYRRLKIPARQTPMAFRAVVEAMDSEIGRLLEAVQPKRPFVFFLGDNGTAGGAYAAAEQRKGRIKGSLYEGGVRVPLIVQHPSIASPGRRVSALASVTDLFATLVELAGIERREETLPPDSVSFVPQLRSGDAAGAREFLFAENFVPNGPGPYRRHARGVRDRRYKLIRSPGGTEHLYDLRADPGERDPLPITELEGERAGAYRRLVKLLERPPALHGGTGGPAPGESPVSAPEEPFSRAPAGR